MPTGMVDEKDVRAKACIFGKSAKKLMNYHKNINKVAGDLCVNNPSLLADRAKLFAIAQDIVREDRGYNLSLNQNVQNLILKKKIIALRL